MNGLSESHRRLHLLSRKLPFFVAILAVAISGTAHAAIVYNTIALSGATGTALGLGPNLGAGVNFSDLSFPTLNASGQIVFNGTVSGTGVSSTNDTGIWSNVGGALAVAAREGASGPGPNAGAGVNFSFFSSPLISDAGRIAIHATVTGTGVTSSNDNGVWTNVSGSLAVAAREGSAGPGPNLGTGVNFSFLFADISFSAAGKLALNSNITGTGVTLANDHGAWNDVGGSLTVIARAGVASPGPNLGAGITFSSLDNNTLNPSGKSVFSAAVAGTGITAANDGGIWTNVGGALAVVAREGSAGPGPNLGAGINFDLLAAPSINGSGNIAFSGRFVGPGIDSTNASGIWSNIGGTLQTVARTGSGGPGPKVGAGVNFSALNAPMLSATGSLAFSANLNGPDITATNDFGLWTNVSGTLQTIAREGSDEFGPELGDGVYFNEVSLKQWSMAMNGVGEVVFTAPLVGTGVTGSNDFGIWAWTNGQLMKIVREGDQFDVNPDPGVEDLRTVLRCSLTGGSGGEDGRRMSLNDDGTVVFSLYLSNGTTGIFTAQLPRQLGDFDLDGDVDGADFVAWQTHFPMASGATWADGDADSDGDVDGADFVIWQTHFPTPTGPAMVPEPSTIALALLSLPAIAYTSRRRGSSRKVMLA